MVITGEVKTLFAMRSLAGRASGLWLTLLAEPIRRILDRRLPQRIT